MASGTVGYTDTRGNKDYSSIIANQIGKRLKEASNMASEERAYAAGKAEAGGTSLEEAGIGKGYFFGRALGSRFGGDRIARTRGRMGASGPGTNPAASYKQRFRGGFDYNVTNQVENITDTAPLSNAVVQGLRGVQGGLVQVAAAISRQDSTMDGLANTQADMAKAIMFNGYLFQMFMSQQKARSGRASAMREERSIEGRGARGVAIGGAGFGGSGGGRGMINVTPGGSGGSGGGNVGRRGGGNAFGDYLSFGTSQLIGKETATTKAVKSVPKALESFSAMTPFAKTSSKTMAQILAGNTDIIAENVGKRVGASPNMIRGITTYLQNTIPFLKKTTIADEMLGLGNTITQAKFLLGKNADQTSVLLLSKALGAGGSGANSTALREAMVRYTAATDATKAGRGAGNMMDTMYDIGKMSADEQVTMMARFGDDAERLMSLGFANPKSRIIQQISKKFPGVKFTDPMQAVAVTEIANRVDKGMDVVDAISDVRNIYGSGIDNAIAGAAKLIPEKSKLAAALAKTTGKTASKGVFKSVLKQIPIIAGVAGVVFGIQRALEGDLMGAGLEITSGLLGATGTTPGLGLAIDGYLLGRDLGALPMRTGGRISGFAANSLLSVNGKALASFNEPGNPESIVVERDNEDRFVDMGKGIVDGFKERKGDYTALQASGVERGLNALNSDGFFSGLFNTTKEVTNNLKNPFKGLMNWFNKGYTPKEDTMKWFGKNGLLADDWNQRGKFGKNGKLGGWDFTRGFRPGVSAEEGGLMSGPTQAGRQSVKRLFGFLTSFRGGGLATLASLVANDFLNPQPLADGTLTGNPNVTESLKLQNVNGDNPIAATVINNYYSGGGNGGVKESGDETLGQSFNMDLEKFITSYSIMSK